MIRKSAELSGQEVTEAELRAINKHTLEPLTADQVYTFRAILCDNETDRQHERFTGKALDDLRKLFKGRPVIKDHRPTADNQVARIYATDLEQDPAKTTKAGEIYTRLVAKAYMVRTASNADLIAEIKGGIKREGSVGFAASGAVCSICGTDNTKTYCPHWPGRTYTKDTGPQTCEFVLTGAADAYEFSLVAIPAQKAAGATKSYTGETIVYKSEAAPGAASENQKAHTNTDAEKLALRARAALLSVTTTEEE